MAVATPFDQPIPGQSLTGEPGNNPWEQPAMMSDLTEITKYYIEKLANQEIIDDFATLCESGLPLKPIVETIPITNNTNLTAETGGIINLISTDPDVTTWGICWNTSGSPTVADSKIEHTGTTRQHRVPRNHNWTKPTNCLLCSGLCN